MSERARAREQELESMSKRARASKRIKKAANAAMLITRINKYT